MTVEELKQRRAVLERDMLVLVKRFEQDAGCLVVRVELLREEPHGGPPRTIHLEARVEVPPS